MGTGSRKSHPIVDPIPPPGNRVNIEYVSTLLQEEPRDATLIGQAIMDYIYPYIPEGEPEELLTIAYQLGKHLIKKTQKKSLHQAIDEIVTDNICAIHSDAMKLWQEVDNQIIDTCLPRDLEPFIRKAFLRSITILKAEGFFKKKAKNEKELEQKYCEFKQLLWGEYLYSIASTVLRQSHLRTLRDLEIRLRFPGESPQSCTVSSIKDILDFEKALEHFFRNMAKILVECPGNIEQRLEKVDETLGDIEEIENILEGEKIKDLKEKLTQKKKEIEKELEKEEEPDIKTEYGKNLIDELLDELEEESEEALKKESEEAMGEKKKKKKKKENIVKRQMKIIDKKKNELKEKKSVEQQKLDQIQEGKNKFDGTRRYPSRGPKKK